MADKDVRSMTERCDNCKFATTIIVNARPTGMLECHRNPPIPVARLVPAQGGMISQIATARPEVPPKHWCGEFKPRVAIATQIPEGI